ncbi:MAG: response regulator [Bacteroidales bacterium]|nr:response regulator [Bacteroidales bacterium]MCF8338832.1 response regulator [Bacteroidales bacterium]
MPKKVLVVDDSESIRDVVSYTLRNEGYEVALAEDGDKALDKIRKEKYRLVVTDLYMPNMDGMELIREIRKLDDYKGVPILFLTTESQLDKKKEAKQAGATGWIVKPFSPEKLLKALKKVLR